MSILKKPIFKGAIQSWGNSLGLRITQPVSKLANLTKGSEVTIEVTSEGVIIKPINKKKTRLTLPYTEAELVCDLTPKKAHADELAMHLPQELGK